MIDCSQWSQMGGFESYVDSIRESTSFNEPDMSVCRAEICNTVYGVGNPDISGIGVIVGYSISLILSIVLSLGFMFIKSGTFRIRKAHRIFAAGLDAFFDSAAYFAFALQLATIAVLIRKDYGISNIDLGALETDIAQAVSVVSLLPLLYPAALLEGDGVRHNARMMLLSVTVALSFYPFVSRCIHVYAKSPIGNDEDADVSTFDWGKVESMCFQDGLSGLKKNRLYRIFEDLELATTLMVYLFTFWLMGSLPRSRYLSSEKHELPKSTPGFLLFREKVNDWFSRRPVLAALSLMIVAAISGALLWVVFEMRHLQMTLAESSGETYEGNNWGFGQIISLVLFAPVGIAMSYQWRFDREYRRGEIYGSH